MIAFVLPLLFIQSPSQEFTTRVALIPVVNVAMMFRQAIGGYFDWKPMAITVAMEILFVTLALKIATTLVEREDFMMDSSGGAFLRFSVDLTKRRTKAGELLQAELSGDAPVVVCNLTKTFLDESRGIIRAVDGISFECRESEVFGLLGANGAGKTTTLRMLSTIIAPTSGTAKILGHDIVKDPAGVRRSHGILFREHRTLSKADGTRNHRVLCAHQPVSRKTRSRRAWTR